MRYWFICLLLLTSCHKSKVPVKQPRFYPVKTTIAQSKATPIYIETLGHVDSITTINIKSRIEGELTGVYFKQGQEVKKGDLLFTVDPKPYQATLKQAEATLEQNKAALALASEKVKRYRILAKDEFYSQIDYESLQTNFATNTALVAQNTAEVDSAKINLDYCWIYAPIDGMMGILQVDYGNLIPNNGSTLAVLSQMAPIYVTFSVPEFQLHRIQKAIRSGKPIKVLAAYENFQEEVFEGELLMVDNSVNSNTGMIALRATFENSKRELWPGQFVRTRLILNTIEDAVLVPYTAIQLTQAGPVVFVINKDNTVDQRKVVLGQREDELVIVTQGLKANEKVVLEGQLNLYTGAKVAIKE